MSEEFVEIKSEVNRPKLRELLADLFDRYKESFDRYQWPWEKQRWYELVFCLLSTVEDRFGADNKSVTATRALIDLGLLDIPAIASEKWDEESVLFCAVLERSGFTKDQAEQLSAAVRSLAILFKEKYGGKVQVFLRQLSEEFIERTLSVLPLDEAIGQTRSQIAVTHWLQNVLNLPFVVYSPGLDALMRKTGAGKEDVMAVVDEMDINAALLDEILNRWVGSAPVAREESTGMK